MLDVEKMLRDGVSYDEIMKKVKTLNEKIETEKAAEKAKEEEEKKRESKIAITRTKAINALQTYFTALGYEIKNETIEKILKDLEVDLNSLKDYGNFFNTFVKNYWNY